MKKYNKVTPEGTKDLLFEECSAQKLVEQTLTKVFTSRGFNEVVTPGLEFYDVFDPAFSGIGQEVLYKMTDRHGRLVVMRPDSTMPIARLTATRLQKQVKPIRLFYTQTVYRNNPGLAGRRNEVKQTGIELLGADGCRADLEVIVTAVESLSKCIPDFRLEIGHAAFFHALAEQLPISDDLREDIRSTIESKNYAALNGILDTLGNSRPVDAMRRLPRLFGGEEVFTQAAPLCGSQRAKETLDYLHEVYKALSSLGLGDRIIVDLGLVQRNNYYTGLVFSAYVEDFGDAVLLGGRYDSLLERFDSPMPAIGFAVNVDAVAEVLLKRGKIEPPAAVNVFIHADTGFEMQALQYAETLVNQGLKCETSIFNTREEAREYASLQKINRVDFVAEAIESVILNEGTK